MKKIVFFLLLVMIAFHAPGQDVIATIDGDSISCKVTRETDRRVKYMVYPTSDRLILSMSKEYIYYIRYASGLRVFLNELNTDDTDRKWDNYSITDEGKADARKYYQQYRGARAGTIV